MLIVICLCLFVLLVVVAFCVDIAYMQLTRTELRAATDAAARAAAEALSCEQSTSADRTAVKNIASLNEVANSPLQLHSGDIEFGRVDMTNNGGKSNDGSLTAEKTMRILPLHEKVGRRTLDYTVPRFKRFAIPRGRDAFRQNRTKMS